MKKLFQIYLPSILLLIAIGVLIMIHIHMHPNVKIGQTWIKEYDIDNPYKEVDRDTIDVIDIKDNYVLYVDRETGDTLSNQKYWVVVSARKLKDNDQR